MVFSRVLSENWRKKIHFLIAYVMDIKLVQCGTSHKKKKKILSLNCGTGVGVKLSWLQNRDEVCLSVLEIARTYEGIRARKSWKNTVN